MIAYGYIFNAVGDLFIAGVGFSVVGFALWQRSQRRLYRRANGLCPACAYPIGTSPVCTECGHQLCLRP
jgi:hypothetical protein